MFSGKLQRLKLKSALEDRAIKDHSQRMKSSSAYQASSNTSMSIYLAAWDWWEINRLWGCSTLENRKVAKNTTSENDFDGK